MTNIVITIINLVLAATGLVLLIPVFALIFFISLFDTGSPLFTQTRLGRNKAEFMVVKFRTMSVGTASVATHLAKSSSITRWGRFLRKSKLDELPQLWNVLRLEMSLVGPRPCLPEQHDLISEREKRGVFEVRPGITGLAQVNNIDMSTPALLAKTDAQMIETLNLRNYFKYMFLTISGKGFGDKIKSQ